MCCPYMQCLYLAPALCLQKQATLSLQLQLCSYVFIYPISPFHIRAPRSSTFELEAGIFLQDITQFSTYTMYSFVLCSKHFFFKGYVSCLYMQNISLVHICSIFIQLQLCARRSKQLLAYSSSSVHMYLYIPSLLFTYAPPAAPPSSLKQEFFYKI